MGTRLIRLDDSGLLIEAEVGDGEGRQIAGDLSKTVQDRIGQIKPILLSVARPFRDTFEELNKDVNLEAAEVELGLSFEGEGNLYLAKTKAGATLSVKLLLKPLQGTGDVRAADEVADPAATAPPERG